MSEIKTFFELCIQFNSTSEGSNNILTIRNDCDYPDELCLTIISEYKDITIYVDKNRLIKSLDLFKEPPCDK